MEKYILIIGATSAIAHATAEEFAAKGYSLYLTGRNLNELKRIADDLQIRHNVKVQHSYFDVEDFSKHYDFFKSIVTNGDKLAGLLFAPGYMHPDGIPLTQAEILRVINVNFTGAVSILNYFAEYFKERKRGFIIGISSVAGDRGRAKNLVYGSAKSGFSAYLQGLRNALYQYNVKVITIKPGYVDTSMIFGKQGLILVASPNYVGKRIANSISKSNDILYIPWFWRYIMLIVKLIPESIFKHLKI